MRKVRRKAFGQLDPGDYPVVFKVRDLVVPAGLEFLRGAGSCGSCLLRAGVLVFSWTVKRTLVSGLSIFGGGTGLFWGGALLRFPKRVRVHVFLG